MRPAQARAAVRAALPLAYEAWLSDAPADILDGLVRCVADGDCTPGEAAAALVRAMDLMVATDRGEISETEGKAIMGTLGDSHRDGHGAD